MRTFRILAIVCIALASANCSPKEHETRYDNVVRIFMHEPHRYTLAVQEPGSAELKLHTLSVFTRAFHRRGELIQCGVRLHADVPNGEPMWAKLSGWGDFDCHLVIHLHDPAEIVGGGWDHGKFGSGTTQVVE